MSSSPSIVVRVVTCAWLGVASALVAQIDPFYADLERDAAVAAARGDAGNAARLYRIACFGMLDEPVRLAACTVRLAIQQAKANDPEAFRDSFSRLATVEERFQGWTLADLSSEERSELARRAAALLPRETLGAIPGVAALAATIQPATAERASPRAEGRRESRPAPPEAASPAAAAPVDRTPAEEPLQSTDLPAAAAADEPAETATPEPAPAPSLESASPASLADEERAQVESAQELLSGRPQREEIEAAAAALRQVAERHPEATEVARLVGDLAYRVADWPTCAEFYGRAGDPGPEAPLERFYMAVCLFETGRREAAAALLEPSVGQLKRSPFVESYLQRILPASDLP
jgi:hypothetical protein